MKSIKTIFTFLLVMISFMVFGQEALDTLDSLQNGTGTDITDAVAESNNDIWSKIWTYLKSNWAMLLLFLSEAITRLVPNASSYSVLRLILWVIDIILPDRLASQRTGNTIGVHSVNYGDKREYPTFVSWLLKSSPVILGLIAVVVGSSLQIWNPMLNYLILFLAVVVGILINRK